MGATGTVGVTVCVFKKDIKDKPQGVLLSRADKKSNSTEKFKDKNPFTFCLLFKQEELSFYPQEVFVSLFHERGT